MYIISQFAEELQMARMAFDHGQHMPLISGVCHFLNHTLQLQQLDSCVSLYNVICRMNNYMFKCGDAVEAQQVTVHQLALPPTDQKLQRQTP